MGLIISHMSASAFKGTDTEAPVVRSAPTGSAKFGMMALTGAIGFLPNASSKLTGSVSSAVDGHWPGTDCFFYVSGSATEDGTGAEKAVFGGDVIISGTLNGGKPVNAAGTAAKYRIAIFDDADTIGGESGLTWGNADGGVGGGILGVTGSIRLKGALDLDATGSIDLLTTQGVSIDGGAASNFSTSAGDLTLDAAAGSINLTGGEADAAAVKIQADNAAGGIDIDAGTGGIHSLTTGKLAITSSKADARAVSIQASNAAGGIDIDYGTGGFALDGTGVFSIDAVTTTSDSNIKSAAGKVVIESGKTGADALELKATHAAGGVLVDVGSAGLQVQEGSKDLLNIDSNSADFHSDLTVNIDNTTDSSGAGTGALIVDGGASVALNLHVGGNLLVQGSTTTISSSNVIVKDPVMALGVSDEAFGVGSLELAAAGDRGFVFGMAGAPGGSPAIFWDHSSISSGVPQGYMTVGRVNSSGSDATLSLKDELPLKAKSFYIDGTGNYIDLNDNNIRLVASRSLFVDAATDIILDAGGGDIHFNKAGTNLLKITESSSDVVIQPQVSDKDIIFKEDGGNEIARFDSSGESLLIASTKKIEFQDTGTFINSSEDGELNLSADGAMADAIKLSAANGGLTVDVGGDIVLDASGSNVTLKSNGTNYLDIVNSSGDAVLSSSVHNKDVIFHGNEGTDVFRLDSSANSLFVASGKKIEFGNTGESIVGNGTLLAISSSQNVEVDAVGDIILDAGGANVTLKDDGSTFLDFVNSSGNVTLDGAGTVSIDSHVGTINLMRTGSSGASFSSVARGFELDVPTGNLFLDAAGDDIEIDNHLIPFDQSGHSNDGKYELGQGIGLKGGSSDSQLGSSSTPFAAAFTQSNGNNASSITMSSTSTEFGILLDISSPVSVGSAISGASTAFGSLSAGSLSTSTTTISQTGGHSMSLTKGQLLIFQSADLGSKMIFVVTEASSPSDSTIFVKYHSGLSSGNASSLSDLASGKAFSGTPSNGGLSLDDESLVEFTVGGDTFIFRLKEAVTSSSSVFFVRPVSGGTGSSFNPTASGRTAKKGGQITTRNAWKNVHTDNIDIANSGIISLGGPDARLDLDTDDDTSIRASGDDVIDFELGGTDRFQMTTSAFVPGADNSYDLGSETLRFRNIFTGDLNLRNDRGDWTLIEEDDFISFRNNKTGRRFRMVMEDITGLGNYGPGNDGEM